MSRINNLRAFRSLAAAACVDGKISQPEMQLLIRKAREMKLEPVEIQQILQEGREGKLPYALPAEPREFQERLKDIVDLVCCDGRLETQERLLLKRFASKAGMDEWAFDALVKVKLQEAQQRLSGQARPVEQPVAAPTQAAPPAPRPAVEFVEERRPPPLPPRDPRRANPPPPPPPPKPADLPMTQVAGPEELEERLTPHKTLQDRGRSQSDIKLTAAPAGPITMGGASGPAYQAGPVTLGGSSPLSSPEAGLSPVTLFMLKSHLEHGSVDEAVRYLRSYGNVKDDAEARRIIDQVLRENPALRSAGRS